MNLRGSRTYVACLILLAACGGGGGSESAATPPATAPTLALGFGYKQLQFSWGAVSGATFYRLSENPDGASGYTVVANNIAATNFNYAVASLFGRLNALYILDACNAGGCTASAPFSVATSLGTALGAYVKGSNTGAADLFGTSIALSGDGNTLAVGATGEDSPHVGIIPGAPDETTAGGNGTFGGPGAVYVLTRSGTTWSQEAYVKPSNTGDGDSFGISIALSNDGSTMAVGAYREGSAATGINNTVPGQGDNSALESGAVYVFTRSGTTWTQQAYVKASNTGAGDNFGNSVSLSVDGNTLAVGAPFEASAATGVGGNQGDNTMAGAGAAYIFTRSGSLWSQVAYVKASNTGSGDNFGTSVALSGDGQILAVGAPFEDSALTGVTVVPPSNATTGDGAADAGAVYVFGLHLAGWSQDVYIKASNAGAGDNFGQSVALSSTGTTLAVGAPREDSALTGVTVGTPTNATTGDGAPDAGAAYIFFDGQGGWAQQAYIKASNPEASDGFGTSVALSNDGNTLAVGAPAESSALTGLRAGPVSEATAMNGATGAGAAYVFTRAAATWTQEAYVKATNPSTVVDFGHAVALNSDGSALAVGADFETSAATGVGGNQIAVCTVPKSNCASLAGAVYLY